MGKSGKIRLGLIILLCLAGALLIALGIERSLIPKMPQSGAAKAPPLTTLPPSPEKKVVHLDKSPNWVIRIGEKNSERLLVREFVRQAFLLSAREEGGFVTRDVWLGDAMSDQSTDRCCNVVCDPGLPNKLAFEAGKDAGLKSFAVVELDTHGEFSYKDILEKTEELSRSKFPAVLRNGGYVFGPKKPASGEKIPPEIEKLLGEMNFISQYSAVRQLHDLMRTRGESPLLQGGLVRGYANLGLLSDYDWQPLFKVFFARSLLYAQRMVAQGAQPRWAKWHRAYAFALSGQQKCAVEDLEEAEKAGKSAGEKDAGDYANPYWVDSITAFCRYDTKSLAPDWSNRESAELNGLLQCVANEWAMDGDLIITRALDMLQRRPECYRLYEVVCRFGGVSVGHKATRECFEVFRQQSYRRLAGIPGLPDSAANIIKKVASGGSLLTRLIRGRDESPEGEYAARRELTRELFSAGNGPTAGRSDGTANAAAADRGEPSWATLGLLIRETSFVQAWRRIYFEADMLGVAPDHSLKELQPLYADHPYGDYLSIYAWDDKTKRQVAEKATPFDRDGGVLRSHRLFLQFTKLWQPPGQEAIESGIRHTDGTSDDLIRNVECRIMCGWMTPEWYRSFAHDLKEVTPWSPYAGALSVEYDGASRVFRGGPRPPAPAETHAERDATVPRRRFEPAGRRLVSRRPPHGRGDRTGLAPRGADGIGPAETGNP